VKNIFYFLSICFLALACGGGGGGSSSDSASENTGSFSIVHKHLNITSGDDLGENNSATATSVDGVDALRLTSSGVSYDYTQPDGEGTEVYIVQFSGDGLATLTYENPVLHLPAEDDIVDGYTWVADGTDGGRFATTTSIDSDGLIVNAQSNFTREIVYVDATRTETGSTGHLIYRERDTTGDWNEIDSFSSFDEDDVETLNDEDSWDLSSVLFPYDTAAFTDAFPQN
jgi:hypothetical protein